MLLSFNRMQLIVMFNTRDGNWKMLSVATVITILITIESVQILRL